MRHHSTTHFFSCSELEESRRKNELAPCLRASDSQCTAINGELRLAYFIAEHHLISMVDPLTSLVDKVCPDSNVASEMMVNRTKMTGAAKTIADVMNADLFTKLKAGWWS